MPLKSDFSSRRLAQDPADPLQRTLANLQSELSGYQGRQFKEAQAAETKRRWEEEQLLKEAADARAAEQLNISKTTLGDTQAKQARQDFTSNKIGEILAAPVGQRAQMLKQAQSEGGFTPSAQEQTILLKSLEVPEVKYNQPDMYKYDPVKDEVISYKPRTKDEEAAYAQAGWEYGTFTRGRKDDNGAGADKKSKGTLFSDIPEQQEKVREASTSALVPRFAEERSVAEMGEEADFLQRVLDVTDKAIEAKLPDITSRNTLFGLDLGFGRGYIDPDKVNKLYKNRTIAMENAEGKIVDIPVGDAFKGFKMQDRDGNRRYIISYGENRKPIIKVNPQYNPDKLPTLKYYY